MIHIHNIKWYGKIISVMRTTITIPDEYYNRIKKSLLKEGFFRFNDFVNHAIREYFKRDDLFPCKICKLPKTQLVNDTCSDCFDTLPDDEKQNYHPLR